MEWVQQPGGLAGVMASLGLAARPDSQRVAVAGQSSGNHVVGAALARGCGLAKAWVMIDPVDGFDPYRIVKSEDLITPGQKLNFTLPSLLLNNGLDPQATNVLFPPCAPEALSNDRFYDAMRGPIWAVNATEFGHLDCCDTQSSLCPTNSSTDKAVYKETLVAAAASFLGALFGQRPQSDLHQLEDPDFFNVSVLLKHNYNGVPRSEVAAGCVNHAPGVPSALVV